MTISIDPYRLVREIVADLAQCPENVGQILFIRSAARVIHERDPDAMLVLALAYCIWRNEGIGDHALAQAYSVMKVLEKREQEQIQ